MTLFTAIFGRMWFLFAGFLVLNIVDWLSGWAASKKENKVSSSVGAKGVLKKVMYWVVIAIAFYIAFSFSYLGQSLGIDLSFLSLLGWFVLANYLVNEIRSILENALRIGVELPVFLVKGLKITEQLIDKKAQETFGKEEKRSEKNRSKKTILK